MNIVLIGMPGCGKSTVGVLLARAIVYNFVDTDLVLQKEYGKSLIEIIENEGIEEFKRKENETLKKLQFDRYVIATGGSAVYGREAMENLKKNAVTVYLKFPCDEIIGHINNVSTRGIVMPQGYTIEKLYKERDSLYQHYADITVENTRSTVEESVKRVIQSLKEYGV